MLYIPNKNNTGYCVLVKLECIEKWLKVFILATLRFNVSGLFKTRSNMYDGDFWRK